MKSPTFTIIMTSFVAVVTITLLYIVLDTNLFFEKTEKSALNSPLVNKLPLNLKKPEAPLVGKKSASKPSFDLVHVDSSGDALIAGRASPGAHIIIMDGTTIIGETQADDRGEWVFIPDVPLKPGNRQLRLGERTKLNSKANNPVVTTTKLNKKNNQTVIYSDETVVVAIPEIPLDENSTIKVDRKTKPLVLKFSPKAETPTEILQIAENEREKLEFQLNISTVDYDDFGNLTIGGNAPPGAILQIYIDNKLLGRTNSNGSGQWHLNPDLKISPGLYSLRVDHIDDMGKVVSRVKYPFSRAKNLSKMEKGVFVVVQPGNSLWRIARRNYGSGFSYTKIFKANSKQIIDPNLIYPGQIFKIPEAN